jgi:outer membrane protein insertion porin family
MIKDKIRNIIISSIIILSLNKNIQAEKISSISIHNVKRISNEAFMDHFWIKKGDKFEPSKLNNAIKRIFNLGLFADISVNIINDEKKDKIINIYVTENPVINEVFFNGNDKVDNDTLKKIVATQSRGSYTKEKIKEDLDKIYGAYQKMGYLNIYVEPKVVFLEENKIDVVFNITEGDVSNVSRIIFIGNESFFNFTLKEQLLSQEKLWINPFSKNGRFEEDKLAMDKNLLTEFYMNKGYANCKIHNPLATFNNKNFHFLLTFFIEEGGVYHFNDYSIESEIQNEIVNKIITNAENYLNFQKGDKFSKEKIAKTAEKIKFLLSQNGYAFSEVDYTTKLNEDEHKADIKFKIKKSHMMYINKINISGNSTTKHQVIMREMMIHEGDLYDNEKIQLSKDRLTMLGYFKKVEINEKMKPNSDLMDLEIELEEQFFGNMNFSIGYSSFEGIIGTIQASINNILGYGYSGSIGISRSGWQESYNLGLYDPYLIKDYNIGLGFNAFYTRFGDLGGGTAFTSMIPYQGQTFGFTLNSGFEIINRFTYNIDLITSFTQNSISTSLSYKLYEQLIGSRSTYAIAHSITWNQLDQARYATKGYLLKYTEKYGTGLANSQEFISRIANGMAYIPVIGDNLTLFLSAEGGFVQNLNKNKQVGIENLWSLGYYKMRGFSFFGLGPRIGVENANGTMSYMPYAVQGMNYYVLTAELQSPLFIPKEYGIKFAAFIDVGSVWGFSGMQTSIDRGNGRTERIFDSASVRMSAGVGLMWQSPLGEIRFDIAQPIIKEVYDTPMMFNIRFGSVQF